MNKQQVASKIWESANRMRSKIEANEYKDYILGFIFYKYLSDKQTRFLLAEGFEEKELIKINEKRTNEVDYIKNNLGYFIAYSNLFSTWLLAGKNFDVSNVRDALSAFSRNIATAYEKVFRGIFDTLQTGLSKLGDTSGAQTKAILGLLELIKDIPTNGKQGYDVLGFIYEYLISMFAANAGKKAGEFYTPHEVSLVMSELISHHLKNKKEIQIFDPTSGSGSLLINIGHSAQKYIKKKDGIKYYAQELKENTYNLTRMNLVMRDIKPDNIITRNADTLEEDWPYFEESDPQGTYEPLYVDAVVSNPPYSQAWDPEGKENDPRYANYGLAPKTKADYAFLLHDLFHVKPDGIMAIVLPHGVLFRGGEEGKIRKSLIEQNHIDAIIGLPSNIFFGTGIPTIIMQLKQERTIKDVLIVDASKGFVKEGKNNKLRACDIKKIVDTVTMRRDIPAYSRSVSLDEIRNNDYNLNIPRYVDSSEESETWDLYASMFGGIPKKELELLDEYWKAFPNLKEAIFKKQKSGYLALKQKDVKEALLNHESAKSFKFSYGDLFKDYSPYLKKNLIQKMESVDIAISMQGLSDDIFKRLKDFPLVDAYTVYQIFDDCWRDISADLEIIQSEGRDACKTVEPNIVIKKRSGVDVEVQEGWRGRIFPFKLIADTLLKEKYAVLAEWERFLGEIPSELEILLDDLSEEEKEGDYVHEDGSAFVFAPLDKKIKELKDGESEEEKNLLDILTKAKNLLDKEKDLKKAIKDEEIRLHNLCKKEIENLNEVQVLSLLEEKWIKPYMEKVLAIPDFLIDEFAGKLDALAAKYNTTYLDIEKEINQTQDELAQMLDELEGNESDQQGLKQFMALLNGELQ